MICLLWFAIVERTWCRAFGHRFNLPPDLAGEFATTCYCLRCEKENE